MGLRRHFAITCGLAALSIFAQSQEPSPRPCRWRTVVGAVISHPHIYITFWRNAGESTRTADPDNVFGSMQSFLTGIGGWKDWT